MMAEDRLQPPSPFFEFNREISRLFHELVHESWGAERQSPVGVWKPRCNVSETDEVIMVEIELPGVRRKDIRVELEDHTLHIAGERRVTITSQGRRYHSMEQVYGRFERRLQLPHSVDREAIRARFHTGILTVVLPKKTEPPGAASPGRKESS